MNTSCLQIQPRPQDHTYFSSATPGLRPPDFSSSGDITSPYSSVKGFGSISFTRNHKQLWTSDRVWRQRQYTLKSWDFGWFPFHSPSYTRRRNNCEQPTQNHACIMLNANHGFSFRFSNLLTWYFGIFGLTPLRHLTPSTPKFYFKFTFNSETTNFGIKTSEFW